MLDWILGGGGGCDGAAAAGAARSVLGRLTLVTVAVAGGMQEAEEGFEERVHDDESGGDDTDVHFDDGEGVGGKICPYWV